MKQWFAGPVILALLLTQFGCVRACRNTLNHYGVYDQEFEHITKVIVAPDGSVAMGGNHVFYRWEYVSRVAIKTRTGWVIGPASNFKTMVRNRMLEIERYGNGPVGSRGEGIKDPRVLPMINLMLEHADATIDKSCLGEDLHYDPWDSIIDKKGRTEPDPALLPEKFKGGVTYDVGREPMSYDYNGKTVSLVFEKSNGEVARQKVSWWAPPIWPFAKITDTALSLALIAWTVPVLPISMVGDGMSDGRVSEFLWPAPFVNMRRQSQGLPPLKPQDFVPQ